MFNLVPRQDLLHKLFEGAKDRAVKCLECMRSVRRHSDTIDACISQYFQCLGMKSMRTKAVEVDQIPARVRSFTVTVQRLPLLLPSGEGVSGRSIQTVWLPRLAPS
jgi:hypothetical protein